MRESTMTGKHYSFSPTGEKLSQVGPDGMVRVWDTATGVLDHEYQPASHLMAKPSCVHYSPQSTTQKPQDNVKKKKKSLERKDESMSSMLAVATEQGTVLVYSPEKRELVATLTHSQPQAVVDLTWLNSSYLFTLTADSMMVKWNVITGTQISEYKVNGDSSLCALNCREVCVAKSTIEHMWMSKNASMQVKRQLIGHSSRVSQLLPLPTQTDPARYLLSASTSDKFVCAWDLESGSIEPVASFMVRDLVKAMTAVEVKNNTVNLAIITSKGHLVLFRQHLNGNTNNTKVKMKGQLKFVTKGKKNNKSPSSASVLPIHAVHFCDDQPNTLIIAYGTSALLMFERVKVESIIDDVTLQRSAPSVTPKKSSLSEPITPKMNRDTTVIGPGHLAIAQAEVERAGIKRKQGDESGMLALPMDERLNALVLDKPTDASATQPPKTGNQIHLLLQGLHSKDSRILQEILSCGDESMITNTVRRLPTNAVVPLLKYLQTLFLGKGHKNAAYVKWVRLVLYHHMSHLSTVPDPQELLRPFYSISASRVSTFMQLTELHARLDLSLTHVATKHEVVKQVHMEPSALLIYRDEDSDVEEEMEVVGGVSESEDNWEELSDIGDVNGPYDSSSHSDEAMIPLSSKRSLEEEEEEEEEEEGSEADSESGGSAITVDLEEGDSDSDE